MPKYKVTWFARYEAEVVAESEEEAISMTGIYNSEYMGAEGDYAEEIKDEDGDWEYEQVTSDASLARAVAEGKIRIYATPIEEDDNA